MDIETMRIDLRRTQERLARSEAKGDLAAVCIAQSRADRLSAELRIALGIPDPTTSIAMSVAIAN